jgi:hypothetical protein
MDPGSHWQQFDKRMKMAWRRWKSFFGQGGIKFTEEGWKNKNELNNRNVVLKRDCNVDDPCSPNHEAKTCV